MVQGQKVAGDIQQNSWFLKLGHKRGAPLNPHKKENPWSSHNENPQEYLRFACCDDFGKSEWECFLSKQNLIAGKVKDGKEIFEGIQSTEDSPSISR